MSKHCTLRSKQSPSCSFLSSTSCISFYPKAVNPQHSTYWVQWVWLSVREGGSKAKACMSLRFCLSVRPAQFKAARFQGQFSVMSSLPLLWGIMRTSTVCMCVWVLFWTPTPWPLSRPPASLRLCIIHHFHKGHPLVPDIHWFPWFVQWKNSSTGSALGQSLR